MRRLCTGGSSGLDGLRPIPALTMGVLCAGGRPALLIPMRDMSLAASGSICFVLCDICDTNQYLHVVRQIASVVFDQ